MADYLHRVEIQGRDATLTWVGQTSADPARVYALAFTPMHDMIDWTNNPDFRSLVDLGSLDGGVLRQPSVWKDFILC